MKKQLSTLKHNLLAIFASLAIGIIIMTIIAAILAGIIRLVMSDEVFNEPNIILVLVYAVMIIAFIGPIIWVCVTYCPFCHKLWAREKIRKVLVDRKKVYKGVDGENGSVAQIQGMIEIYQIDYRCKYCGKEWSRHYEKKLNYFYE